ncbi:MAG: formylglycine-generating enzyme family protein [Thermoguttaceae bacterium]|nr:formylglycine-generating enzyme family protein [Thermoguttaceae bacterium]
MRSLAAAVFVLMVSWSFPAAVLSAQERPAGDRMVLHAAGVDVPMRWIPAGSFQMGSPKEEPGRDSAEVLHKVTLTSGFWMSETEVTQRLYRAVAGENPSQFAGDDLPVDTVSWDEAVHFCETLQTALEKDDAIDGSWLCRLPSEAQWEYACRAGDSGSGIDNLPETAWSGEPTQSGSTHPVGTKAPNAWGLCDMHGNLWEWCADSWNDFTTDDQVDPLTLNSEAEVRIDRGGCWDSTPYYCRTAWRGVYEHYRKSRFVGFRFVLIEPSEEDRR